MAQLRHGVGTSLWPPRQKNANLSCGNDSIHDDVTASVPAVVIAIPKPPPLPASLPPRLRSLPGEDFHLLKIRRLLSRFASCQLTNFPPPLSITQRFSNRESRCESQNISINFVYFFTSKHVTMCTQQSIK